MKKTLVLKFGGSSVATIERIFAVSERIAAISRHYQVVVVVSAMGDETDDLLELASAFSPHAYSRECDMLLATGEQKSAALLSMALQSRGVAACALTGWQAHIHTTDQHGVARIVHIDTKLFYDCWQGGKIPVVAGFQGVCHGEITTLGRGGSDLSAVALAAALKADECQIFTDVDGIYFVDPRIVPNAYRWPEMTYSMMLEFASVGAQVLHYRAVELAYKADVTLRVLSSFSEGEGTVVAHEIKKTSTVSGIAVQRQQAVVHLTYAKETFYHHDVFALLNRHSVLMSTLHFTRQQHAMRLSFALPMEECAKVQAEIQTLLGEDLRCFDAVLNQAQISIVGIGVQSSGRVFLDINTWLAKHALPLCLATSSESRFSFYVDENRVSPFVKELYQMFCLNPLMACQ